MHLDEQPLSQVAGALIAKATILDSNKELLLKKRISNSNTRGSRVVGYAVNNTLRQDEIAKLVNEQTKQIEKSFLDSPAPKDGKLKKRFSIHEEQKGDLSHLMDSHVKPKKLAKKMEMGDNGEVNK